MNFNAESAAFLHLLQQDLFGPASEDLEAVHAESTRVMLSGIPETEREMVAQAAMVCQVDAVPTPQEDPSSYGILTRLAEDILIELHEPFSVRNPPLVGTLPVGLGEVILLRVPDSDEHLVVVDDSLLVFANLLAKACAQALMPITTKNKNWPGLWEKWFATGTYPGLQRYIELIGATVRGRPIAAPVYWPDATWRPLAEKIRLAMELFVVAGPFVQLALHQQNPAASEILQLQHLHPRAESYAAGDEQRLRIFLLRLVVTAAVLNRRGCDRQTGYWGIEMFLRSLFLIEALQAALANRECPTDTRAQEELGLLRQFLAEAEGADSPSIRMLEWVQPIAEGLMSQAELAICGQAGDVH